MNATIDKIQELDAKFDERQKQLEQYELQQHNQLELFRNKLPRKTHYTNKLQSCISFASKDIATQALHIRPNHDHARFWLVFDIDRRGAAYDWQHLDVPPPNIVAGNPKNGHAHLFYSLNVPVRIAADASSNAMRFAAAVEHALCIALDADKSYAGFLSKNPLNDHWCVDTHQSWCYDLPWLSEWFDLSKYNDRRKNLPDYGLGRNCNTFHSVRKWSYKAIRSHDGSYEQWLEKLLQRCLSYNQNYCSVPLPITEQQHIAKSIARWTWANMRSGDSFVAWCKEKGRRGGMGKGKAYEDKREQAKTLANSGVNNTQIAKKLGVSRRTVINWSKAWD